MKRFREGLVAVIMVAGFMGFLSYDFLVPAKCNAEEKAVKKEAAVKETKAVVKETKAVVKKTTEKKAVKKELTPVVMVEPKLFELAKSVSVDIMGKGFNPDQEVRILFTDSEGMQTDIGYAVTPNPITNKSGAFLTTWTLDEFIKANLIKAGAFSLTVTDSEFKPLAGTVIFVKPAKKAEKK